jgi:hypothetical protein
MNDDFPIDEARLLIELLDCAYAQFDGATAPLPNGLIIERTLHATEQGKTVPFGFVASMRETPGGTLTAYVVIRGTRDLYEWRADATIQQVPFRGIGNATLGFSNLYDEMAADILAAIKLLAPDQIVVTGHSLGAALAHLAQIDIWRTLAFRPESITFEGPRTLDPVAAAAFRASGLTLFRVFNTEDIVPTIPVATMRPAADSIHLGLEFEHIGEPVALCYQKTSIDGNHALAGVAEALKARAA